MEDNNQTMITGHLVLSDQNPKWETSPRVDREVCEPYSRALGRGVGTTKKVNLSDEPFKQKYLTAEFHSPIITLDCRAFTPYDICENDQYAGIDIRIPRLKNDLLRKLFGENFDGEIDMRNKDIQAALQDLFKGGKFGSIESFSTERLLSHFLNNQDFTNGEHMRERSGGKLRHYTGGTLSINDISFFIPDSIDKRFGSYKDVWNTHNGGYGRTIEGKKGILYGRGYVIITKKDFIELGKVEKLFMKRRIANANDVTHLRNLYWRAPR